MVRVVVAKLAPKKGKRRRGTVTKRRVRGPDGEFKDHFWVDANSDTFGDDLTHVFKLNVARARQENKRMFGFLDGYRESIEKLKLSGFLDDLRKK